MTILYFNSDMAYRGTINLRVLAGVAKPNPKMGQALGPLGLNMMKFCDDFNKKTSHIRPDVPMKVRLVAYSDRTYKFDVKPPETSWFLHKASGTAKFTPFPGHDNNFGVPIQYVYQIAKIKKQLDKDFEKTGIPEIMNAIIGQMSSCGLEVVTTPDKPDPIPLKSKA